MNNCYKHSNLAATRICRRCGRELCEMCQMFQAGDAYCTACFEIVHKTSSGPRPNTVRSGGNPVKVQSSPPPVNAGGILRFWKLFVLIAIVAVAVYQRSNVIKLYHKLVTSNIQKIQNKQNDIKTAMLLPEAKNYLMTIESRLKLQKRINETYPNVDMFETFLKENMATEFKMGGGEKDVTIDPWGSKYHYELQGKGFYLSSFGPDKVQGTEDDIVIIETE